MSQFKVGGKVVALKDAKFGAMYGMDFVEGHYSISKGEVYTVRDIKVCDCRNVTLDIGMVREKVPGFVQRHSCSNCGFKIKSLVVWIHTKYFVPLEDTEFKQVEYTKIIEQIPACAQ